MTESAREAEIREYEERTVKPFTPTHIYLDDVRFLLVQLAAARKERSDAIQAAGRAMERSHQLDQLLDQECAARKRLKEALRGLKFKHDCWCADPDAAESHELACRAATAALAAPPGEAK